MNATDSPSDLTPNLQLLLAVGPAGAARKRGLWRSRILGMGQVRPAAEAMLALPNGTPQCLINAEGRKAMGAAMGGTVLAGMVAEVPKRFAPQMSLVMHLVLAARLRENGDPKGALAVEQAFISRHRNSAHV